MHTKTNAVSFFYRVVTIHQVFSTFKVYKGIENLKLVNNICYCTICTCVTAKW